MISVFDLELVKLFRLILVLAAIITKFSGYVIFHFMLGRRMERKLSSNLVFLVEFTA